MDDENLLEEFLRDTLSVQSRRVRDSITEFTPTFRDLLSTTDDDIDTFVKETHSSNSARAANQKILIPASAVTSLKSVLFELNDRDLCDALPNAATLQGINAAQLVTMKNNRRSAIQMVAMRRYQKLPDMQVPKLLSTNFEEFNTSFSSAVRRQVSLSGISLSYLLRDNIPANYDANWPTREDKLRHCLRFNGPIYEDDNESLYSFLVQHIGTIGVGSNIVNKYKTSKDGRACYLELTDHFKNDTYLENKATAANKSIVEAKYYGDRRNFTLETYYAIMSQNFLALDEAGPVHRLTEEQKITKFEGGLVEDKAISYSIQAKTQWNMMAPANKTFDSYYNLFSSFMNKHNTMSSTNSNRRARITQVGSGRGRGRGRGSGRGRGRGRGRGSGRGRTSTSNPYQMSRPYGAHFTPEAKIYPPDTYRKFTRDQRQAIVDLKVKEGWTDGNTPPSGFTIDKNEYAVPSNHLISAIRASMVSEASTSHQHDLTSTMTPLPPIPPPREIPPGVPPIVMTSAATAGQSFGRTGTRAAPSDSSIASVTINGRTHVGPVFDSSGHRIA